MIEVFDHNGICEDQIARWGPIIGLLRQCEVRCDAKCRYKYSIDFSPNIDVTPT